MNDLYQRLPDDDVMWAVLETQYVKLGGSAVGWIEFVDMILSKALIPVDECVHGNIDPHLVNPWNVVAADEDKLQCKGAGLDE
jgi:hypothetical protein